ncbi:alpha/beta hydrolase domain-containing protein [Gordonia defluvii]|uniref:Alpha/beta hydrolase domain-containing protein n=1 Tax=Gordonia defluvii TaxID=283718 RepID=A0ABP6LM91_9ACTN|nr:alpha/beta hydrolase domain-containing protein [Gordonia sp. UBA5067]
MKFTELTGGAGHSLMSATPGPDLAAHDYTETEYAVTGSVPGLTPTGPAPPADFTTRVLVRRPASPHEFSGTLVVEWLNVSSGADAAPEYTYVAAELVRAGHAWVGVSAQYIGVEGGSGSVEVDAGPSGLAAKDPDRYAKMSHPGDAYCYDMFAAIASGLPGGPLADLAVARTLAVGESQSAMALTTYVNSFAAAHNVFDGFLIHSRAVAGLPFGAVGAPADINRAFSGGPMAIPDVGAPVFIVQTETDLLTNFRFFLARQRDSECLRVWEIAGSAHADLVQVGPFEEYLGCPDPVNRGQQGFVLRAALRHLVAWARGNDAPPTAEPLRLVETDADPVLLLDDVGNAVGGVRTPCVQAPTTVLSGIVADPVSRICLLFGSTHPIPDEVLAARYDSVEHYLRTYAEAVDAAISAGFVLADDHDEIVADAHPELLPD